MKQYIRLAIVMVLMLFVLTGCTNTQYDVKIKKNGKGTVEYKIEYDEDIINNKYKRQMEEVGKTDVLKSIEENAKKYNYSFQKNQKDGFTSGCVVKKEFDDIAKDFKAQESIDENHVAIKDDSGIKVEKGFFITKYSQSLIVDTNNSGDVINTIKITYHFPLGISTSNADKGIFNLTWNVGAYQERKIEYTVYSFNTPLIIIIVVAIIAIIVLIIKIVNRDKKEKNTKNVGKNKRIK